MRTHEEWLLSLDNLFVFHLVFQLYKTPPQVVHKAGALFFMGFSQFLRLQRFQRSVMKFRAAIMDSP